jgi:hypothetical protein
MAKRIIRKSSDLRSNEWVRSTPTVSAHCTMLCVDDEDDVSNSMLHDLEREYNEHYVVHVTSPDDRLLAMYSGRRSRSIRGKF